ncbi:MAG TPA: hypothetical protein V6D33_04920 [Cyanophyceae cyanobacterium]
MTHKTQLRPWCIIRPLPHMQHSIVARFQRRSDAESHLQVLRQLLPNTGHTIMFDVTPDNIDSLNERWQPVSRGIRS